MYYLKNARPYLALACVCYENKLSNTDCIKLRVMVENALSL